jgi:hypothetical protein
VSRRVLRHVFSRWDYRTGVDIYTVLGYALLQRNSVRLGVHPMNGGSGRVLLDAVSDYAELRREYFGLDLVPLPHALHLSAADEALNRAAKLPANLHA